MGEQLDLFDPYARSRGEPHEPLVLDSDDAREPAPPPVLPGQLSIFDDRWLFAVAAHRALDRFDLRAAQEATRKLLAQYPRDASLTMRERALGLLAERLEQSAQPRALALLSLEDSVPDFAKLAWHKEVARSAEVEQPALAGEHWLAADEPVHAERALHLALATQPDDALTKVRYGNALVALARTSEARVMYRDVFATVPSAERLALVIDPAVQELALRARCDLELPRESSEWIAAVGVLDGVFLSPDPPKPDALATLDTAPPGLRFYTMLAAERHAKDSAERISWRRRMKALAPSLLPLVIAHR